MRVFTLVGMVSVVTFLGGCAGQSSEPECIHMGGGVWIPLEEFRAKYPSTPVDEDMEAFLCDVALDPTDAGLPACPGDTDYQSSRKVEGCGLVRYQWSSRFSGGTRVYDWASGDLVGVSKFDDLPVVITTADGTTCTGQKLNAGLFPVPRCDSETVYCCE